MADQSTLNLEHARIYILYNSLTSNFNYQPGSVCESLVKNCRFMQLSQAVLWINDC